MDVEKLGVDVISLIINNLEERDWINFYQCSKHCREIVLNHLRLFVVSTKNLRDEHLQRFKGIQSLYFSKQNVFITNSGIEHLPITDLRLEDGVRPRINEHCLKNFSLKYLYSYSLPLKAKALESSTSLQELRCGQLELIDECIQGRPINTLILNNGCFRITGNAIKNLPLTKLVDNIGGRSNIGDEELKALKSLTNLDCEWNSNITDEGIRQIPLLNELHCARNGQLTHKGIANLPLTKLSIRASARNISDETMKTLTCLKKLNCGKLDPNITDKCLEYLNLTELSCGWEQTFSDEGIMKQTNLLKLKLGKNNIITDRGIRTLTNLTYLDIHSNDKITEEGLKSLPSLKVLRRYIKGKGRVTVIVNKSD